MNFVSKFLNIITGISCLWLLLACETTRPEVHPTNKGQTYLPAAHEFRGVWIYDPRRFNPEDVMRDLKNAGFNAVFVRLSSAGSAYYPSNVLPKAPGTDIDYAQAYADAGRKYGIQVHAWHVCFMMHYAPAADVSDAIKKGYVMRNAKGQALRPTYQVPVRTPALYSNQLLEQKAMVELITKYPLDGVQFDYIRYFSPSVDYSATSRAAFEKMIGKKIKKWPSDVTKGSLKNKYHEWKMGLINSVVRDVSQAVKRANPQAQVSAAVWHDPKIGTRDYAQDWGHWVREGYLDFIVPMDYTPDEEHLQSWIENQREIVHGKIPLYAGLGSYMLNRPEQLNRQIGICRQLGLKGYVLYNYDERLRARFLQEIPN